MTAVLIGCEYTATVRDAFRRRGVDAFSCDILPTEGDPAFHLQCDVRDAIRSRRWSAIILHVDCTAMAVCGNKHYATGKPKHAERLAAIEWSVGTWELAKQNADHAALENPASVVFPHLACDRVQYVQPWMFGHTEQKKTGLALHNLPKLSPTRDVHREMMALPRNERERVFFMSPSERRGLERARFYSGIAEAMAQQWGDWVVSAAARDLL